MGEAVNKSGNFSRSAERASIVEAALMPGGIINEIALAGVEEGTQLSPQEAANLIIRPKQPDEANRPRYEVLADAGPAIKDAADLRAAEVYNLAQQLGSRKEKSFDEADKELIDKDKAVLIIEGGANKSSVVRRQLAIQTARHLYGNDASHQTIFQLGSSRQIPREKNGKPNNEYAVAQEIAADFLPQTDNLTEFSLALASAQQDGYMIEHSTARKGSEQIVIMSKEGFPSLYLVQPQGEEKLTDGIDAVHEIVAQSQAGVFIAEPYFQPVIITNGQYRAKSELRAEKWAQPKGLAILPQVAIGDEPGYVAVHNGQKYTTGDRGPNIYVTEVAVLYRMQSSSISVNG